MEVVTFKINARVALISKGRAMLWHRSPQISAHKGATQDRASKLEQLARSLEEAIGRRSDTVGGVGFLLFRFRRGLLRGSCRGMCGLLWLWSYPWPPQRQKQTKGSQGFFKQRSHFAKAAPYHTHLGIRWTGGDALGLYMSRQT